MKSKIVFESIKAGVMIIKDIYVYAILLSVLGAAWITFS